MPHISPEGCEGRSQRHEDPSLLKWWFQGWHHPTRFPFKCLAQLWVMSCISLQLHWGLEPGNCQRTARGSWCRWVQRSWWKKLPCSLKFFILYGNKNSRCLEMFPCNLKQKTSLAVFVFVVWKNIPCGFFCSLEKIFLAVFVVFFLQFGKEETGVFPKAPPAPIVFATVAFTRLPAHWFST